MAGPDVLRISKGLHQKEGADNDVMHLTMRLLIPGSSEEYLVKNTHLNGSFHFFIRLLSSTGQNDLGHSFQPIKLTYRTLASVESGNKGVLSIAIPNAEIVDRDLRTTKK